MFLLADTREKLRGMIQDVTNVIGAHGMRWKHNELFVLHIGDAKQILEHDVIFVVVERIASQDSTSCPD